MANISDSTAEVKTSFFELGDDYEFSKDAARLWKRRYETSCDWWKKSDHRDRCDRIVKYLHNDFSSIKDTNEVFLNQFFISLKTLIPLVIAHNPFVAVNADNDIVYEYDEFGQVLMGADGEPIMHDMSKTAQTIQGLLKRKLDKVVDIKGEMRSFLRNAITFNRGIYLVGHTVNAEYGNAFDQPLFHAYIKSISPRKVKRQAGTTRIDEGTYFFYEYELPVSHLKKDKSYKPELLKQCTQEVLENVKIDEDGDSYNDSKTGYYDDVKFIKLHNAYNLETGEVFVFGKGCEQPLKVSTPKYTFKNPTIEFIPNETFQPDQNEPVSDLMMVENIVKKVQKILKKSIRHIENFNTGINIEESALTKVMRKRIEKSTDRAIWVFKDQALAGGHVQPRGEVSMGSDPFNLIEFLLNYVDKTLAVYNFQTGGDVGQDETATKTQARVQSSQFKSGDMSDMFVDSCNKAIDKYLEVLVQTTDTQEVVEVIGDAGEVEYRPFNGDEARRGQFYCTVDLQSMGKVNEDVKVQQALKFYEILKSDPDPMVQQKFDKMKLLEKIADGLRLGKEGIIRKTPDTKGMDEQTYRDYLKQQMLKAEQENSQVEQGADPLPPSPDDEDEVHLTKHLGKAQELKSQVAGNPDPALIAKAQPIIDRLVKHSQPHIERKAQKDAMNAQMTPKQQPPISPPMGAPRQQVANRPPMPGQIAGQAQQTGGM